MHEFLRDNLTLKYGECKSCKKRSQFACTICGFCWSCHWKQEPYAENIPRYLLKANGWLRHEAARTNITLSGIERYEKCWSAKFYRHAYHIIYPLGHMSNFYHLKNGSFMLKLLPYRGLLWYMVDWSFSSTITTWTHCILILFTTIWTIFNYWQCHANIPLF